MVTIVHDVGADVILAKAVACLHRGAWLTECIEKTVRKTRWVTAKT